MRPTHGFARDHVADETHYWQYRHGNEYNLDYYAANEDLGSPLTYQKPPTSNNSDNSEEGEQKLHEGEDDDGFAKKLTLEAEEEDIDEMEDDGKGEDSDREKSNDSSGGKKEDASMTSGEGSSSSGKISDTDPNCHELWPDHYGWEGTKPVDKTIGGVRPGAGTWDLFYSLDNGYWDENHDVVLEKSLDCLQD